ncbi:MAG TPA: hypothetical protein VHS56_03045 [Candidatus Cybelea sp.]|jgi:hypothetical protein|nr:hypothetical protein [Candidatus Cybelea sp.]
MRLSFLCASAALAAGLALSACSSGAGSSSTLPSSGAQALAMGRSGAHGLVTRPMPGVKQLTGSSCNYSVYAFCIEVTPGNSGPYIETSAGSGYELYNNAWIVKNKSKKGKIDKKFDTYFYPDPGNPTYQYIDYTGKNPKKSGIVKYTDYYCIGFAPSTCSGTSSYTFKIGIALVSAN